MKLIPYNSSRMLVILLLSSSICCSNSSKSLDLDRALVITLDSLIPSARTAVVIPIANSFGEQVELVDVKTSCGCAQVVFAKQTIGPRAIVEVELKLDTSRIKKAFPDGGKLTLIPILASPSDASRRSPAAPVSIHFSFADVVHATPQKIFLGGEVKEKTLELSVDGKLETVEILECPDWLQVEDLARSENSRQASCASLGVSLRDTPPNQSDLGDVLVRLKGDPFDVVDVLIPVMLIKRSAYALDRSLYRFPGARGTVSATVIPHGNIKVGRIEAVEEGVEVESISFDPESGIVSFEVCTSRADQSACQIQISLLDEKGEASEATCHVMFNFE